MVELLKLDELKNKMLQLSEEMSKLAKASPLQVIGFDWLFKPSFNYKDCSHTWYSIFVQANGDITFCYNYKNVLGNAFKENPLRVWNNSYGRAFRKSLKKDVPACRDAWEIF